MRQYYTEAELIAAINADTISALFTESVLKAAFEPLSKTLQNQFAGAMDWAAKDLKLGVAARVFFDVANPRHLAAVDVIRTRVIQTLKDDVRAVVLQETRLGILNGVNPRTTARALRATIGLSADQAAAVRTFREELLAGDRKALQRALGRGVITQPDGTTTIRGGHAGGFGLNPRELAELKRDLGNTPIDPKKIDKWVEQYRKRTEAFHAESVSRSATLDAMKHGQHEATQSAIDKGFYDAARMVSRWVTTLDGRERPEHHALNGSIVPFDTPFANGEVIPGEASWNCRCSAFSYELTTRQFARGLAANLIDTTAGHPAGNASLALT